MKQLSLRPMLVLLVTVAFLTSCGGSSSTTAGTTNSNKSPASTDVVGSTLFTSEAGGFSVTLPAGFAPFQEKRNEATKMTGYTSSGPNDTACNISYSEFSDALAGQLDDPEKMDKALGAMRENSMKGMNGLPDKEEKINLQGHPGLSVHGMIAGAQTLHFRMDNIIANKRGYRFGCLSTNKEELDKPEIKAFFNSFQLK